MLKLAGRSLRRRLQVEWWAATAVVTVAILGAALGLFSRSAGEVWLLVFLGVVVAVAATLLTLAFRSPVAAPPTMPRNVGYEAATNADRRVRRGKHVEPPEVQAAAIGQVRRGLRISHMTMSWFPVLGATWAVRIGEPGLSSGSGYVGIALILLGSAGLVWSRVLQARLDRLERTESRSDSPVMRVDGSGTG